MCVALSQMSALALYVTELNKLLAVAMPCVESASAKRQAAS